MIRIATAIAKKPYTSLHKENSKMLSPKMAPHAVLSVVLGFTVLAFAGCDDNNTQPKQQNPAPQPGDTATLVIERNGTPVYEAVHEYVSLPESESRTAEQSPTVIALLKTETYHDEGFRENLHPVDPVTEQELTDFLVNHWDAHVSGIDDDGHNLEAFLQFLRDHSISMEQFMAMFQRSGKPIAEFANDLFHTRAVATREESGSTGLAVAKFAWDVLKDGKPQLNTDGALTSVLNAADSNWSNYWNAQNAESDTYRFIIKENLMFTSYNAIDVQFKVVGTYGATHPTLSGHYIPSLYVKFAKTDINWGHTVDADASVSNVSNIAGADVNPQIDFLVHIKDSTLIQCWDRTITYRVTGKDGIKKL